MSLTKDDVGSVIKVINSDPECQKRISSFIDDVLPDTLGISGATRNWGYVFGNIFTFGYWGDPTDKEFADRVCTGIAEATANAINNAITNTCNPGLINFKGAGNVDRVLRGTSHTATSIIMKDDSRYVFDWHATLNIENPMLYKSLVDWKLDRNGVVYADFSGWK
jgi:hypothetical protein